MSGKRMPSLVIDEVILLVDTYFQLQEINSPSVKNGLIKELSDNMKTLPFFPELKDDDAFRSPEGMRMCLANVGFIDPNNPSKFGHGSALQKRVFEYYKDKKGLLRRIARAIISLAHTDFAIDPAFQDFIGGQIIASYHKHLEATNNTVKYVLNENIQSCQTICKMCGCDLSKTYLEAEKIMEVHVNIPVDDYVSDLEVYPASTILLCPTCHKVAHSDPKFYNIEIAKERLKDKA